MKIAACWITMGDEELEELKRSVDSVFKEVQSIHITANGDKTKKTEKWCKQNGFHYSYLKWNKNFSEQRNFNFSQVPKDTDYIFWMDCDDILHGADKLKEVAAIAKSRKLDCIYLTYWYSCWFDGKPSFENIKNVEIKHMRERLIKPGKMMWKKRIHETPTEFEGSDFKHSQYPYDKEHPMVVIHTSAHRNETLEQAQARNARNRELLELELADERKVGKPDPRTILYLMKIYAEDYDIKILDKCIEMGFEYLELSGWDEERMQCRVLMGRCYENSGDSVSAVQCYKEAINEYALRPNPYIRLANALCNVRKYPEANHWVKFALSLQEDKYNSGIDNILENELLSAQVLVRLHYEWDKNKSLRKAAQFAEKIVELNPHEDNVKRAEELRGLANLDIACEQTDKLCQYLISLGDEKAVLDLLQSLPQAITSQPFALNLWKKYSTPRIWQENEIAYYCGAGYEKWDATNLSKGIGGSETAVIELAKEWAKFGYKVTVYGDPLQPTILDGVTYLPYYHFNPKDKFNIFINWRSTQWVQKISAKKFYVDLHDVTNPINFDGILDGIDKIMVKSEAHRDLLYGIPNEKIQIISNGIR